MSKRKSKHVGMWLDVDGEPFHMLADPNMSSEAQHALEELIRAARKYVDELPVYKCPNCGEMSSGREGKACTRCMIADFWKD